MTVSVVIACYGSEAWRDLAYSRAVPSVQGQPAMECIVSYSHNGTLASTRNAAADMTAGEWLCFLDADDELAPGYLEAMMVAYARWLTTFDAAGPEPPAALLVPRVQYVHEDGREEEPRFPNRHQPFTRMNWAVIGTLVPRDLFFRVGGFPDLPVYEDYALFRACVAAGAVMVDVPQAVYRAHVREGSRNVSAVNALKVLQGIFRDIPLREEAVS